MSRWLAVVVALWLPAAPAAAKSCIRHAYEHMDLARLDVRSNNVLVEPPSELGAFDQLLNSGDLGKALLFQDRDGDWERARAWFRAREAIEPSVAQRDHIEDSAVRTLSTSCGYPVRYTPILPGRYVYSEEYGGGPSTGAILPRHLTVSADRQRVTFEFSLGARNYEARYEVTCAYFDWERDAPRSCGPKEVHVDPAPAPASAPVSREPPTISPPASAETPPAAARGCALAPTRAPTAALLILGLALLRRRR